MSDAVEHVVDKATVVSETARSDCAVWDVRQRAISKVGRAVVTKSDVSANMRQVTRAQIHVASRERNQ